MLQVQTTEAKAKFAQILRTVEQGETVVITRHGKKIARIIPDEDAELAERKAAVERFKAIRKTWEPTGMTREEILAARHEGHRY